MNRLGSVLLLAVVGCSGSNKDTSPTFGDDDDDNSVETADTAAEEPAPKLTAEVRFRALIAWDADLGQVVSPIIDGSDGYISAYIIGLYETGWSDADETSFCQVSLDLAGLPLAAGVPQEGYQWGIDVPEGLDTKPIASDCLEAGFAPEQFTDGDPAVHWGVYDWKLRFGGVMSAELIDWLDGDTPTADFDIAQYAAGSWSTETAGFETEDDSNYWYAYAMDDDHNVDFDRRLSDFEMVNSSTGEPITAYYIFDQRVFWNLDPPTTE